MASACFSVKLEDPEGGKPLRMGFNHGYLSYMVVYVRYSWFDVQPACKRMQGLKECKI